MPDLPAAEAARWIPLLVIGMTLNTLGIALTGIGAWRYALMAAGLALLLLAVLRLLPLAGRRRGSG